MLPHNIDLTEHHDFGEGSVWTLSLPDERIEEIYDDGYITSEEYDAFVKMESIFGRKRHFTEKRRIFDHESKYIQYWKTRCNCCGKEIRVPWDHSLYGGLCRKCDSEYEKQSFPWNKRMTLEWNNRTEDVFNLK